MSSRQEVEQEHQKQDRKLEAEILVARRLQQQRELVEGERVFALREPLVGYPLGVRRGNQRKLPIPLR
jgi:hypothetical protein